MPLIGSGAGLADLSNRGQSRLLCVWARRGNAEGAATYDEGHFVTTSHRDGSMAHPNRRCCPLQLRLVARPPGFALERECGAKDKRDYLGLLVLEAHEDPDLSPRANLVDSSVRLEESQHDMAARQ
jgi:hypothetical protein